MTDFEPVPRKPPRLAAHEADGGARLVVHSESDPLDRWIESDLFIGREAVR